MNDTTSGTWAGGHEPGTAAPEVAAKLAEEAASRKERFDNSRSIVEAIEKDLREIAKARETERDAKLRRYDAILRAGASLNTLKGRLHHGDWLPELQRLGLNDQTARNYMSLAAAGLKSQNVLDLGGLSAAYRHLRDEARKKDQEAAVTVRVPPAVPVETPPIRIRREDIHTRIVGDDGPIRVRVPAKAPSAPDTPADTELLRLRFELEAAEEKIAILTVDDPDKAEIEKRLDALHEENVTLKLGRLDDQERTAQAVRQAKAVERKLKACEAERRRMFKMLQAEAAT